MKQRLGLAASLMGNPKLLILDEPTNGLDPSGILDLREIVKKAARERGMAVFISSHILSEIQNLCDRVAFINDGVIKSVEDIKDNNVETRLDSMTLTISGDLNKAVKILNEVKSVNNAEIAEENIHLLLDSGKLNDVLKALINNDIKIEEIYKDRNGLEQRYMELVEGGVR